MRTDLIILGVGNLLMSDDGVGIHAVRQLALDPPAGAGVVDAAGASCGAAGAADSWAWAGTASVRNRASAEAVVSRAGEAASATEEARCAGRRGAA